MDPISLSFPETADPSHSANAFATPEAGPFAPSTPGNSPSAMPFLRDDVSGIFTVGESGWVYFDFLFDGGAYEGQLGFFSLSGLEMDSPQTAFEAEAIRRATGDNRRQGGIIIDDTLQGARYGGDFGPYESQNWDQGNYDEVTGFYLGAGTQFALVLMPQGDFAEGQGTPLFSIAEKNPGQEHQFADITGEDFLFGVEDLQVDKRSDQDYNDLVFSIGGAVSTGIAQFETVADSQSNWRELPTVEPIEKYSFNPVEFLPTDPLTGAKYKPGELNVEIDPSDISIEQVIANTGAIGATRLFPTAAPSATGLENFWVLQFEPDADLVQKREELANINGIKLAGFNELIVADALPPGPINDAVYLNQYDPDLTEAQRQAWAEEFWGLDAIDAPMAWAKQIGSHNVTVAVVDAGVNYNHPDLAENIANLGKNFIGDREDPDSPDHSEHNDAFEGSIAHGSLVAGIIGATGYNGIGVIGVSPKVKILPIKVLEALRIDGIDLEPDFPEDATAYGWVNDAAQGIRYASDHADIINASFSIALAKPSDTSNDDNPARPNKNSPLWQAIAYAEAQDVLLITSSGQFYLDEGELADGQNIDGTDRNYFYPSLFASDPINPLNNILSVTATGLREDASTGEKYEDIARNPAGEIGVHYGQRSVHLAAPGNGHSTNAAGGYSSAQDNFTSYAAAFVSGAAAALLAENPELDDSQLKHVLMYSGDKIYAPDSSSSILDLRTVSGRRLNLHSALEYSTLDDPDYPANKAKSKYDGEHFSVSVQPTATNIDGTRTYTPNGELPLDITLADLDGYVDTVTLTLSDPAAGNFVLAGDPSVGGATWSASGAVTDVNALLAQLRLDLADGYAEDFSIAVEIGDNISAPLKGTINFTANDAPVAVNDAFETNEDTAVSGNVLTASGGGEDRDDNDGDVIRVAEVNGSTVNVGSQITLDSGALLTLNSDGTFTYDPNGQFEDLGEGADPNRDSFTYKVIDNHGAESDEATATITIMGVNDAPVGQDDVAVTIRGQAVTIPVLDNDSDLDFGDSLSVSVGAVSNGFAFVNGNNKIVFTPDSDFDGETSFSYALEDKAGKKDLTPPKVKVTVKPPLPAQLNLSELDGDDGFVISGINTFDRVGSFVSQAGDINNDGLDDLIIGAWGGWASGNQGSAKAGESYVVFGGSGIGGDGSLALSTLDGSNGFVINGIDAEVSSASASSNLGDINNDGIDDIIIGVWTGSNDGIGVSNRYIIFGGSDIGRSGSLDLSALDGSNGFVISSPFNNGRFASGAISDIGDINNDGVDDFLVGDWTASSNGNIEAGKSYVVFGSSNIGSGGSLELSDLNGNNGFVLNGIDPFDWSGGSATGIGDINNDGIEDLIIGAYKADPNGQEDAGENYVVFGSNDVGGSGSLNLSNLDGSNGFTIQGVSAHDLSNPLVSRAGDLNNDGIDDIVIGASQAEANGKENAGKSYVIFGGSNVGSSGTLNLTELNGPNGFVIRGENAQDFSGWSVSGAGDFNGDGINDLTIGAPRHNNVETSSNVIGKSYVVFGGSDVGNSGSLELFNLDGTNGFAINGIDQGDWAGRWSTAAGDLNGDGLADLVLGGERGDPNGIEDAGEAYVVFGVNLLNDAPISVNDFLVTNEDTAVSGNVLADNGNGVDSDVNNNLLKVIEVNGVAAGVGTATTLPSGALLTLNNDGTFDYDPNGQFDYLPTGETTTDTFTYTITDSNGGTATATANVTITGINDPPRIDPPTTFIVEENAAGAIIGELNVVDPEGEPVILTLDDSRFEVIGKQLKLKDDFAFDFETLDEKIIPIQITASDEALVSPSQTFGIQVLDVNEAPPDIFLSNQTVDENRAGTVIGELSATDPEGDTVTFTVDDDRFEVVDNQLKLRVGESLDFETEPTVALTITVSDTGQPAATRSKVFSINVLDIIEGFPAQLNLSDLDGSNGFVINGIAVGDLSGYAVSDAGDINADGIADILITAKEADPNGNINAGESYVVFGGSTVGDSGNLDLSSLNGNNGFVINGIAANDELGVSIDRAGDINNDGIDDIIIGAFAADPKGKFAAGESYVVFGDSEVGKGGSLDLAALNGSNGFALAGAAAEDYSGISVSGAGDVNDDGIDDLIIGAFQPGSGNQPSTETGKGYVVFGGSTVGNSGSVELVSLNGSNGFVINGVTSDDNAGFAVSDAGDVNADGIADVIIGAVFADPNGNSKAGESYVVFGGSTVGNSGSVELTALNGSNGFVVRGLDEGDNLGWSVSGIGDFNADGIDDLVIGAVVTDAGGKQDAGESYLVFGDSGLGSSGSVELTALNGSNGFVVRGLDEGDNLGWSVSDAGDVNADGIADLILSAVYADPNGNADAGESYVVFGGRTVGSSGNLDLANLDGSNGFVLQGIAAGNNSGQSVSGAGDFNHDGIDDIIIGATGADPNGQSNAGESYVVFGVSATTTKTPITIDFDDLDTSTPTGTVRFSTNYQSLGAVFAERFSNGEAPAFAVHSEVSGHDAVSEPNSVLFGFSGQVGVVDFVNPATGTPATTDFVSAQVGDESGEVDPITLTAYDINGNILGTDSYTSSFAGDFGTVSVSAPGISRVEFTDADPSGASYDNLTFNPVDTSLTILDFDDLDTSTPTGTVQFSTTYQSLGAVFTEKLSNGVEVPASAVQSEVSGHDAISEPNSVLFGFDGQVGVVNFVNPVTGAVATTDFVSAQVGDASPEADPITLTAYDVNGNILGTDSYTSSFAGDFGTVSVSAPGISRIEFTDADPSGASYDNLIFKAIDPNLVVTRNFLIADTEFIDSDWTTESILLTNGSTITVQQEQTLKSDAIRSMSHNLGPALTEDSKVRVFHEFQGATYTPSVSGEILSIDYSEEHIHFNPPFLGAEVAWRPAIQQDGTVYVGPYDVFSNFDTFATGQQLNLTQTDFIDILSDPSIGGDGIYENPNFSTSGGALTFGYFRSNANTSSQNGLVLDHSIDNWEFKLITESAANAVVTISDSEFSDDNWQAENIFLNNGSSTNAQQAEYSKPNSVRSISHNLAPAPSEDSRIIAFHEFQGASYNPSLSGEILELNYSEEHILSSPNSPGEDEVGWQPAIRQDGVIYVGPYDVFSNFQNFEPGQYLNLIQSDFNYAIGSPNGAPEHPDFSANGGEITFGFLRSNTHDANPFSNGLFLGHDIDNWQFELVAIPNVNTSPIALDDSFYTYESKSLVGNLLIDNDRGADSDIDDDLLTVTQVNGTANSLGQPILLDSGALLTLNSDGSFTYNPNDQFDTLESGEKATDSFTYTITDGRGGTATATSTITINGSDLFLISDSEFLDRNWAAETYLATNVSSSASAQQEQYFGQDNFRSMTLDIGAPNGVGQSYIDVFHEFQGATYNPSISGEILSVNYSEDHIQFDPPFTGAGVSGRPAVKQDGIIYTGPGNTFTNFSDFETKQYSNLTESDFLDVPSLEYGGGDGVFENPDFSNSGGEITFGYIRASSTGVPSGLTLKDGIDNWQFELTTASVDLPTRIYASEIISETGDFTPTSTEVTLGEPDDNYVQLADNAQLTLAFPSLLPGTGTLRVFNFDEPFPAAAKIEISADNVSYTELVPPTGQLWYDNTPAGYFDVPIDLPSGFQFVRFTDLTADVDGDDSSGGTLGFDLDAVGFSPISVFLINTFNSGAEGWTVPATDGELQWNLDGYITLEDIRTDPLVASVGPLFTGDLSRFDGGTLSFDATLLEMSAPAGYSLPGFGEVTIDGSSGSVTLDLTSDPLPSEWTTYSAPLTAAAWGLTQSEWDAILSDVVGISVGVDSYNELGDTLGLDNFTLSTNVAPIARDDAFTTYESISLNGNVLANNGNGIDSDSDGNSLTVTQVNGVAGSVGNVVTLTSGALLMLNSDGTFNYDPNGQFDGLKTGQTAIDTFTYTINDGQNATDHATVAITINGLNELPSTTGNIDVLTIDGNMISGVIDFTTNPGVSVVRNSLTNTANFGSSGTIDRSVNFLNPVSEITPASLDGVEVVLLSNYTSLTSETQRDVLRDYVEDGGGVFAFGNDANKLAPTFGATADPNKFISSNFSVNITDAESPLVSGLFGTLPTNALLGTQAHTNLISVGPNGRSAFTDGDGIFGATFEVGKGQVALFGDEEIFLSSEPGSPAAPALTPNWQTVFLNSFAYAAGESPSSAANVTTFSDEASFISTLSGTQKVLDFEAVPVGSIQGDEFANLGFIFDSPLAEPLGQFEIAPPGSSNEGLVFATSQYLSIDGRPFELTGEQDSLNISIQGDWRAVGFEIVDGVIPETNESIVVLDKTGSVLFDSNTVALPAASYFGIKADVPIGSILIAERPSDQDDIGYDNFRLGN